MENLLCEEYDYLIDDKIKALKEVGEGFFSKVYLGCPLRSQNPESQQLLDSQLNEKSGVIYAIKLFTRREYKKLGLKEYEFLKKIDEHPHIIRVFQYFTDGNLIKLRKNANSSPVVIESEIDYMTMEYCKNGDLFTLIKKNGKLPEKLAKSLFVQLLDAVEFLHSQCGTAHLDLKPENILIGNDFKLKLCDFGFIEDIKQSKTQNIGTDGYKAPEIYFANKQGFDAEKADIFSLGVILFILIFGVPPFKIATKDDSYYRIFYRDPAYYSYLFKLHPAARPSYQKGELDVELMDLLISMMEQNPDNRPKNIAEIRKSPYFVKDILTVEESMNELKSCLDKIRLSSNSDNQ